jgi:hypothetical protein
MPADTRNTRKPQVSGHFRSVSDTRKMAEIAGIDTRSLRVCAGILRVSVRVLKMTVSAGQLG